MSINTALARELCWTALIVNILCVQWIPNNCQLRSWERLLFRPLSYISTLPALLLIYWRIYCNVVNSVVLLIYLGIKSVMNLSVAPWPLTHFSLLPIKPRAKLLVKCLSIQSICILPPTNFKISAKFLIGEFCLYYVSHGDNDDIILPTFLGYAKLRRSFFAANEKLQQSAHVIFSNVQEKGWWPWGGDLGGLQEEQERDGGDKVQPALKPRPS